MIFCPDGTPTTDPIDRRELARRSGHGVAHFNMIRRGEGGRFTGMRIWNEAPDGHIDFVADIEFDASRRLARHMPVSLAKPDRGLGLIAPPDPMTIVARHVGTSDLGQSPAAWGRSLPELTLMSRKAASNGSRDRLSTPVALRISRFSPSFSHLIRANFCVL